MICTVVRQFRTWKQYRTTYNALSRMNDRELDDIGVSRGDLAEIARNTYV